MEDRDERMARACAAAGCAVEAGNLVIAGLDHALKTIGTRRHVTAEDVLCGMACVCTDLFGLLAMAVLRELGISDGNDVGRLVHAMITEKILEKDDRAGNDDFGPVAGQLEVFIRGTAPVIVKTWGGAWQS